MAGKHVRVSAEKKSHATKRSFSSSDAKNISQQCQKIQEALNEIAKSDAIYRESIQQETNRYVATQVLKLMEKIPVEEVKQTVVPEKLRTLDHGRPWSDDQFASTRLSSNRDMSR